MRGGGCKRRHLSHRGDHVCQPDEKQLTCDSARGHPCSETYPIANGSEAGAPGHLIQDDALDENDDQYRRPLREDEHECEEARQERRPPGGLGRSSESRKHDRDQGDTCISREVCSSPGVSGAHKYDMPPAAVSTAIQVAWPAKARVPRPCASQRTNTTANQAFVPMTMTRRRTISSATHPARARPRISGHSNTGHPKRSTDCCSTTCTRARTCPLSCTLKPLSAMAKAGIAQPRMHSTDTTPNTLETCTWADRTSLAASTDASVTCSDLRNCEPLRPNHPAPPVVSTRAVRRPSGGPVACLIQDRPMAKGTRLERASRRLGDMRGGRRLPSGVTSWSLRDRVDERREVFRCRRTRKLRRLARR